MPAGGWGAGGSLLLLFPAGADDGVAWLDESENAETRRLELCVRQTHRPVQAKRFRCDAVGGVDRRLENADD